MNPSWSFARATTSASSATRSPSGCSTTAGSRRSSTSRFPKHDLVIRNLGFSGDELTIRLRSADFGTPDQWLAGSAPVPQPGKLNADAPVPHEPLRADRHQGRRHLRLLRLQRVVRRRGRARRSSRRTSTTSSSTRSAQKYNGKTRPAARALLADRARGPATTRNLPDGSENNERLELYTDGDGRGRQGATASPFVDLFAPDARRCTPRPTKPLTINGVHLNEDGNRQRRRGHRRRPCSPASRRRRADAEGTREAPRRPSSTRTSTGSTATARPTATRSTAAGPT